MMSKSDVQEYRCLAPSPHWEGALKMTPITGDEIRALVQPGRVNRRLYTDPEIFDLELERIFGSAWIYVGHESQVRNPGDFLATRIGRRPLLLVRDAAGKVQ